jgi:hypothetical protein
LGAQPAATDRTTAPDSEGQRLELVAGDVLEHQATLDVRDVFGRRLGPGRGDGFLLQPGANTKGPLPGRFDGLQITERQKPMLH